MCPLLLSQGSVSIARPEDIFTRKESKEEENHKHHTQDGEHHHPHDQVSHVIRMVDIEVLCVDEACFVQHVPKGPVQGHFIDLGREGKG